MVRLGIVRLAKGGTRIPKPKSTPTGYIYSAIKYDLRVRIA